MSRVLENIHHFNSSRMQVRVWASATDLRNDEERLLQQKDILQKLQTPGATTVVDVAESVATLPFVNAVEIVHEDLGGGVLIYPEWP